MHFLYQGILPSPNSSIKVFSIIIAFFFCHNNAAVMAPGNEKIPAVIVFGDSIVDSGNNNYITTIVKCNFPPYGRDFPGEVPTGRFSNGRVPSDFIAEFFDVKKNLPPYLDPSLEIKDLLTGVSFASGASGYDPLTSQTRSVLSLADQLNLFRNYVNKIKAAVGDERTATILSKSIYIVCTGTNDILNTYLSTPFRRPYYDIPTYTDLLINFASNFTQELYGLGARKIGIIGLPVIGCVPSERLNGRPERPCSEEANQAARLFNSKLNAQISSFNQRLPEARLVYLDVYYTSLSLIQKPAQYGFEVANRGCCGTGNIEAGFLCNPFSPGTCNDASKYIFWDSCHPSEAAYSIIVSKTLNTQYQKFF